MRGLDTVIDGLRESDSAFDKIAVELYDWAKKCDQNLNKKRVEALEKTLVYLTNEQCNGHELKLSDLGLRSFPNVLEKCKHLVSLDFQYDELIDIPFGFPPSLTTLDLRNNLITQITPDTLENVPANCEVNLLRNPLSADTINWLDQRRKAGDDKPYIHFRMQPPQPTPSLSTVLAKLDVVETVAWKNIQKKEAYFAQFLALIFRIKQTSNISNPDFKKNAGAFLTNLVSKDRAFRAPIFMTADNTQCHCDPCVLRFYNQAVLIAESMTIEGEKLSS
ncbi:hypothetical protein [Candidatus Regiella endosymbiont of Tuberolachnus salignus]|uniref:hypothetical protein n=1 Tax=Candidatus Regiella endosymbiont of Tuberolachnus salignus TaxID=3077956 RepID=UPI0030CE8292